MAGSRSTARGSAGSACRLELVKSLRVDMDNSASVVAANTNRTKKSSPPGRWLTGRTR